MRWRKPASDEIIPGISEEQLLRAGRDYVASAFPNPDRIGCPGRQRLEVLARQPSAPDEGDIDHLMTCSACFGEYHAIRKASKRRTAVTTGTLVAAAREQVRNAQIDLRPFEKSRGESSSNARGHLSLPVLDRANLLVAILLPTGSPEGHYVFQLLDSNGSPRVETSGNAAIRNYVTTAEAPFDLRAVSAGRFALTVRRAGE